MGAMKSGSFQAIGFEGGYSRSGNASFFLLLIGALQFLALTYLGFPAIGPLDMENVFLISLVVTVGCLIGLLATSLQAKRLIGTFDVAYVDRRDDGGELELTYAMKDRASRDSLAVEKVEAFPGAPLAVPTFQRGLNYAPGTEAHLAIRFKRKGGRLRLELGFPSSEEMDEVYRQLM